MRLRRFAVATAVVAVGLATAAAFVIQGPDDRPAPTSAVPQWVTAGQYPPDEWLVAQRLVAAA